MNIQKFIPNKVTVAVARQVLTVQKHSPVLLLGAGIAGIVVTVVLASKSTLKLESVLVELEAKKKKLVEVKPIMEAGHETYTEEVYRRDTVVAYVQGAGSVLKLYAPSIALGVVSIGFLIGSHNILSKRNTSLMAAYATIDKAFSEYRRRVIADVGEAKDREYRYGYEMVEVTTETTNGPKVSTVKQLGSKDGPSMYARYFEQGVNSSWSSNPDYNLIVLRGQQQMANDRLNARGHLMLNDVYEALGFDHTPEGCVVGWVKGYESGDGYVDFGIFDSEDEDRFNPWVLGENGSILLDFNVDGQVFKLIGKKKDKKRKMIEPRRDNI